MFSDNQALKYLHNTKKSELRAHNLRTKLMGFDFDVVHVPGTKNGAADALSRCGGIADDGEELERSRLKLYELADKQIERSPESSSSEDVFVRTITTRRRKKSRKVTFEPGLSETETSDDNPTKRKAIDSWENSVITEQNLNKRIGNLKNEEKMKQQILASSTPLRENEIMEGENQLKEVPMLMRKRGRKPKPKPLNIPQHAPRFRGFNYKDPEYSPIPESPSKSKFWETPQLQSQEITPPIIPETMFEPCNEKNDEISIENTENKRQNNKSSILLENLMSKGEEMIRKNFKVAMQEKKVQGQPAMKILIYEEQKKSNDPENDVLSDISTIVLQSDSEPRERRMNELEKKDDARNSKISEQILLQKIQDNMNDLHWIESLEYNDASSCAEQEIQLIKAVEIEKDGDCLFNSLLYLINSQMSVNEFKKKLLDSPLIAHCQYPNEVKYILKTPKEWGNSSVIYLFSKLYKSNVCVHLLDNKPTEKGNLRINYAHFVGNESNKFIHLHLFKNHYTPLIEEVRNKSKENGIQVKEPRDPFLNKNRIIENQNRPNEKEVENNETNHKQNYNQENFKKRPDKKPPWNVDIKSKQKDEEIPELSQIVISKGHPFLTDTNLVYLLSADCYPDTEVIRALTERDKLNLNEIKGQAPKVGEVIVSKHKKIRLFGLVIKPHFDSKHLRIDLNKTLKLLRNLSEKFELNEIAIVRDLDMMNPGQIEYFLEQFNALFFGKRIRITYYKNNLITPPAEDRLRIIKEFHSTPAGGHFGTTRTAKLIAAQYHWKGLYAEVVHVVRNCLDCQKKKHSRIRTRLPLLITTTQRRVMQTISLDYYGPLRTTSRGNNYVLTCLDLLSKYLIAIPLKESTASETARALVEHVISKYGAPENLLTDQGSCFQSKVMEGLARIFKIKRYRSSSWHPQTSGSIERQHWTLTQFLKQFCDEKTEWDQALPLACLAFNSSRHESTGYPPLQLLLGYKQRIPSSFPPRSELMTYDEYLANTAEELNEMQTLAALNLIQSKHRSKEYYDRKINPVHFRLGERVYLINRAKGNKIEKDSFIGPYEITGIQRDSHNLELKTGEHLKVVHMDQVKRGHEIFELGGTISKPNNDSLDEIHESEQHI